MKHEFDTPVLEPGRHLFLDLEETLTSTNTDGWIFTTPILNHTQKVKKLIESFRPHYIHVFSFAILNDVDRSEFLTSAQVEIEEMLGQCFVHVFTIRELLLSVAEMRGFTQESDFTIDEFHDFYSKQDILRQYLIWSQKKRKSRQLGGVINAILIDDQAYSEKSEFQDYQLKIDVRNISSLK